MPGIMAVAVVAFAFSSQAMAEIYTWTDAQDVVHFTDTPPPDINYKSVEVIAPVIVPMANNLDQQRRVSKTHDQVQTMLSSDGKHRSAGDKSKEKALAKQKQICATYRRKLARIQSQLRAGYSHSKGNSLRRKRRSLNRSLSLECILR